MVLKILTAGGDNNAAWKCTQTITAPVPSDQRAHTPQVIINQYYYYILRAVGLRRRLDCWA